MKGAPPSEITPCDPPLLVAGSARFPVIVCVAVKVLAFANCGTLVVSRFRVTVPLVPPPVRSVPAVTPVIVPVPPSVAQAHDVPFHCNT